MFPNDQFPLIESLRTINRKVHGLRLAIQYQLRHAQTHRGRGLETRAAESAVEVETVGAGRAQHGVLVRRDAVVAAVGGVQSAVFHQRDALADAVNAALNESFLWVVGIAIWRFAERISIFKSDQSQIAFGTKIHFVGEINHGRMARSEEHTSEL